MEYALAKAYMEHGYSLEDAFRESYADMYAAGFEPCVPRGVYSCVGAPRNIGDYDSKWTKHRQSFAREMWLIEHPGCSIDQASDQELYALTYDDFPTFEFTVTQEKNLMKLWGQALPIGTFIIYPGLGTCEILAHKWRRQGRLGGTYVLKVLRTGKTVDHVAIDSEGIVRQ